MHMAKSLLCVSLLTNVLYKARFSLLPGNPSNLSASRAETNGSTCIETPSHAPRKQSTRLTGMT
ncbi:hypothetical protein VD0004_g9920 [Verticillium dahliae]|nr:hypothetical protein VD0004_g9920 [Verticillium dahliae]PNH59896.1 hypothetical protein VD0001_g9900 [Verticillium dahliae]